ncbi:MAG TPA: hypothetical protein VEG33_05175 [Streptosporangiaceae bacterium]|nr:hypothetical protein [Streptosporangiaceae bacterium]
MSNTSPMSNPRRLLLLLVPLVALFGVIATSSAAGAAASGGTTISLQDVTGSTAVCNDTVVTVTSGVLKIVTHETLTPSGAYHLSVEANAQGVHAVAPTGAAYQLPGGFHIEMNATPGATTQTEVDIFHAIGQGSAPNFTVRGVVHTTIDANGNVTALVDHFTATGNCTP